MWIKGQSFVQTLMLISTVAQMRQTEREPTLCLCPPPILSSRLCRRRRCDLLRSAEERRSSSPHLVSIPNEEMVKKEKRKKKRSGLVDPLLSGEHQKCCLCSSPLDRRLRNPFRRPSLSCANKRNGSPNAAQRRERGLNLFQMAPGDDIIYTGWIWLPR